MEPPEAQTRHQKICFVISPIGNPGSETNERANQIFDEVISPAVIPCGYQPLRADKVTDPGTITSQNINHLFEAPLVIADITGGNPNVYYELALRHAFKKPVICIYEEGEQIPFDISSQRIFPVRYTNLKKAAACRDAIAKAIIGIQEGTDLVQNPVTIAGDYNINIHSNKPEARTLAEILRIVQDISSQQSQYSPYTQGVQILDGLRIINELNAALFPIYEVIVSDEDRLPHLVSAYKDLIRLSNYILHTLPPVSSPILAQPGGPRAYFGTSDNDPLYISPKDSTVHSDNPIIE